MPNAPSKPADPDWTLLGANVRALRKSLGWTREHLAEGSGVGLSTLKRVEGGGPCSFRTQQRLAAAFNATIGSLWEPRLFDDRRVSVFRPEHSRWRFANSEQAAEWALNEDKRQVDPDAIQSEDERLRLGRNGLAAGFARIFRRQFPAGYLGCVVYECFAREDIGLPPHVDAVCLYGVRGEMLAYLDGEPTPLREGDVLVHDASFRLEIAPQRPVSPHDSPPVCFGVLAQLGTARPRKQRSADASSA